MTDKWLEIFLWYSCNLKCKFCFQKDLRFEFKKNLDKDKVIDLLNEWYSNWKRFIIFSWWEPTLDSNMLYYLEFAKNLWYEDIRIHTNWLTFSSMNLLKKYVNAWMTWVVISIHWYSDIHNILVKNKFAFEKVKKTLLNLVEIKKKKNIVIDTNTVLNRYNYKNLHKLFKFFSYFPITRSQIIQLYSLYMFDINEKKNLYVKYDDFSPYLDEILSLKWVNITLESFPLCKIKSKHWNNVLKRQKYNNDAFGYMWEWLEESSCTFLPSCESCSHKDFCIWIPKDYLSIFPKEKFSL